MNKAVCLIILGAAGSAWALGPLGPTTTNLRQGQWELGLAYTEGEQDLELDNGDSPDVEDAELSSTLIRATVGLATNRAELFGLIGWAEFEDENSDDDFVMGAGARITATSEEELNWGIVAQIVRYEFDLAPTELRMNEIQVGIGPTWRRDGFLLYGGPMLHFLFGEFDNSGSDDIDLDQDTFFGGYLGIGAELFEHLTVQIEGQVTADSRALSAGLSWRF